MKLIDHRTELMSAAINNDEVQVKSHIDQIKYQNSDEGFKSALMYAAERGNISTVIILAQYEARLQTDFHNTALMFATQAGYLDCCIVLNPLESDLLNNSGETALVYAAYYGHAEICKLLIKQAGIFNNYGEFPLVYAITQNNPECVRILLPVEGKLKCKDGRSIQDCLQEFQNDLKDDVDRQHADQQHKYITQLIQDYQDSLI